MLTWVLWQVKEVTRDDFVLPTLGPKLLAIHTDLLFGAAVMSEHAVEGCWLGPANCF